jgi:DNA-binding response OmpR family regulator
VILDLGLPEIDGLTVLGMWRKEGRKFPVLVLTARDSWSTRSRASMPGRTTIWPSRSRPRN